MEFTNSPYVVGIVLKKFQRKTKGLKALMATSNHLSKRVERSLKDEIIVLGRKRGMEAVLMRGKSENKGLRGLGLGIRILSSSRKSQLQLG
ncbi:hypothetical protein VNO78_19032 [Psophocarpus tetragonolobus]|uniref:Uncharacterized protein n=1 Tax=Psophocarpus tetragonolobus TaxID=3891 RepID=A0AAN9S772_PSOTE